MITVYALLPLVAFFSNLYIGYYIFSKDPENKLNKLYALFAFSMAVWSMGDFFVFISRTPEEAVRSVSFITLSAPLASTFFLHFILAFTKNKILANRVYTALLYLPAVFFIFVGLRTDLIISSAEPNYWGYDIITNVLYLPYSLFISLCILISFLVCLIFYFKGATKKEKKWAKFIFIGLAFPFIGGNITEIVLPTLGIGVLPLSSSLSTVMVVVVGHAIGRYKFMAVTSAAVIGRIIETISDYLVVLDRDKNIVLVNKSILNIIGKERGELVGKSSSALPIKLEELYKELEGSGSIKNYEMEIIKKEGTTLPVSVSASLMRDTSGEIIGFVFIFRDISSVKKMIENIKKDEENLKEANEQLTQMNKTMVGRELKMVELKKEIEELKKKLAGG